MSHRNRHPETSSDWRAAVERSLQDCRASHSFLLASTDTPLGPFLIQAANRFQVPVVEVRLPFSHESFSDWDKRTSDPLRSSDDADSFAAQLWISPIEETFENEKVFDEIASAREADCAFDHYPLVDRALMAFADKVRVISVVPGSKTEWLIRQRLDDDQFPTASVFIAMKSEYDRRIHPSIERSHRTAKMFEGFLDRGAVGWFHSERITMSDAPACASLQRQRYIETSGMPLSVPLPLVPWFTYQKQLPSWSDRWPYLSHCTRACNGAWPDQSQAGYYDRIIAAKRDEGLQGTAFETLKRILLQQRLIASAHLNRSGQPTVSLTEVSLEALLPRRQFQSHLGRWDWESYGICINRRWIANHGGRPVFYSNAVGWNELKWEDRPFFQPTRDVESQDRFEWELEREWRVVGDIHLANIPFESAVVFVPSKLEAAQLASISRFPIMVV